MPTRPHPTPATTVPPAASPAPEVPLLRDGMRMTQPEFHRIYEMQPPDVRAELIGGVVYMASPQRRGNGRRNGDLYMVLRVYELETPGTHAEMNNTTILDRAGEPEPDVSLRILPEFGGQSEVNEQDYVEGPPELVIEVSDSTIRRDLTVKKDDYQRTGVREYVIVAVPKKRLMCFDLQAEREIGPDADGVFRSRVFPGLWIDAAAALAADVRRMTAVLQQGLATSEHAEFVKRMKEKTAPKRKKPGTKRG